MDAILTVDEVIALEQRIAAQGTSLRTLMERAGGALAQRVREELPDGGRVLVLCGSGNNGGDGWVAARLLTQMGCEVSILATRKPEEITAEPARSAAADFADQACYGWNGPQVIVDCLLGTGFNGAEVTGVGAEWIRQANESDAFRLACDVPSGLSARTGAVAVPCFKADATVTMLAVKEGLTSVDAAAVVGELLVAPLMPAARRKQAEALWGNTDAYQESAQRTKNVSSEQLKEWGMEMMDIFAEFGALEPKNPASEQAQQLVKKLQEFITSHYYTCTDEILAGLGQMYAAGGEFTDNIDAAGGKGTAVFAAQAIAVYCGK